jgi:deoxyribose-phosphate aldolase
MKNLATYIDHTLLKQDASASAIVTLCEEAKTHGFASVCIQPHYVPLAAKELEGSSVLVCTVIGFPLGQNTTEIKVQETMLAIAQGAQEIDMVINLSWVKERKDEALIQEIAAIKAACGSRILKVILETSMLSPEDIVYACKISQKAGANFVKTSTGFANGGATVDAVRLMKQTVGDALEVKASGGIRDLATMEAMIAAGATRIGTSSGIAILAGQKASGSY